MNAETNRCLAAHHRAIADAHGEILEGMHVGHPQRPHHATIEEAHQRIAEILDPLDPPVEDAAEPERQPGDTWCGIGELDDRFPNSTACDRMHGQRRPGQDPKMRGVPALIKRCKHCGELKTEPVEEPTEEPKVRFFRWDQCRLWVYPIGDEVGWWFDTSGRINQKSMTSLTAKAAVAATCHEKECTRDEAEAMLADWPDGLAKFRELLGESEPEEPVEEPKSAYHLNWKPQSTAATPEPTEPAEELPPLSERMAAIAAAGCRGGCNSRSGKALIRAIAELEARPPRDATCGECGIYQRTPPKYEDTEKFIVCPVIGFDRDHDMIACVKIDRKDTDD